MTGEWLIRQPGLDGRHTTERITIENDDPRVTFVDTCITFIYRDDRELIFPYANILRAEYRPHTQP